MSRPRGRPPKSADPATRDRLLAAAVEECVAVGFEAVTLANVAARAGVTPAAVYHHFAHRDDLLTTAGRVAIERLHTTIAPTGDNAEAAHQVVLAFLSPSFRSSRRLILELHLAGARHPALAAHLADWHREFGVIAVERSSHDAERATVEVKALFLLMLGCCHLDDLAALESDPSALEALVDRLVDAVYGQRPAALKETTRTWPQRPTGR